MNSMPLLYFVGQKINANQIHSETHAVWQQVFTIIMSSSKKFLHMFKIKFPIKCIFQIF